MFVKIENGAIAQYPYTVEQLRADNPNVSFPTPLTPQALADFDVFEVGYEPAPEFDPRTQYVVMSAQPVLKDGMWVLLPAVVQKTSEQIAEEAENIADSVREIRNRRLAECDWTQLADSPADKAAWAAYRQALRDISAQPGFPFEINWPEAPQ